MGGGGGGGRGGIKLNSLFTRVIHKHICFVLFLHPALTQTRDYPWSNYICTEREEGEERERQTDRQR